MKKHFLAWILLGVALQNNLPAAEDLLSSASFAFPTIQEAGSARAIGLGSTYVGIAEGSAALLWNPAGLSTLSAAEIGLHHNVALMSGTQDIAVLGLPLGYGNALGLSLDYEDNGVFEGRDIAGLPTGNYASKVYSGSLGWGIGSSVGLSGGLAVKMNRQDLAGIVSDAFAADAGLLWSLGPQFTVGAAYTNFGPEVAGRQLSQGVRVGVSSYLNKCEDFQWLLALSEESMTNGDNSLHFGLEHTLYRILALRAGYGLNVPKPAMDGLVGWTFGGGIQIQRFTLDYAYVPLGDLGNMQRVSLTYSFGEHCAPAPKPVAVVKTAKAKPRAVKTPVPAPVAEVLEAPVQVEPVAAEVRSSYIVKKGDSLWSISGKDRVLGDSFAWPLLFKSNRDQISDPDLIDPKQDLRYKKAYSQGEITEAVEKAKDTPRYAPHTEPRSALQMKY